MQDPVQGLVAFPSLPHREFRTALPSGATPTGDPTLFPPTLSHFSLFLDVFSILEVPLKSPSVNWNQLWLQLELIN